MEMERAVKLRDQVLTTWSPPVVGQGCITTVAQTATMVTLAWCFPGLFDRVKLSEA